MRCLFEGCLEIWVVTVGIRALGLSEFGDRTERLGDHRMECRYSIVKVLNASMCKEFMTTPDQCN